MGDKAQPDGRYARGWAHLLIALFVLRVLLPAGIMPDLAAARAGHLELTLCSADGLKRIVVDRDGQPVEPGSASKLTGDQCPFGSATAKALTGPSVVALPVSAVGERSDLRPSRAPYFRALVRGPPLGSRAPPHPSV